MAGLGKFLSLKATDILALKSGIRPIPFQGQNTILKKPPRSFLSRENIIS